MTKRLNRPSSVALTSVAAALLTVSLTGCHHDPNVQKQKYLESGKRYASEGKYKEAAIQFSNALKVDRNFGEAHYQLGTTYLKMGSAMPAYAELSRAVAVQPDNIKARLDLGNLLLGGKQPDRAAAQAQAILAIKADNPDAYALLSSVAVAKGDRAGAVEQIQHALTLDPNRAAFHTQLALIEGSQAGNAPEAEAQLRKAVSLDGGNAMAHMALSSLLERKGDLAAALEQEKAAVAGDPKNLMARAGLAELYLRQGDKGNAEATLRQAAEDLSEMPAGAQLLESYYLRTNQGEHGAAVYADLVAKHPKSVPLKVAYTRLLLAKRDVAGARTQIADLAKTNASDPDVAVLNGMMLINDGKSADAFNSLQKAAKGSPESVPLKLWMGRAALLKGDLNAAQQSFTDATRLSPANAEAEDGLAQVAMQRHDPVLLAQAGEAGIASRPQSAIGYLWRGMAEASQQQPEKADADLRMALKYDPKNWGAALELAQLKLSEKHVPEAKALLEQVLTENPASSRALALLVSTDLADKQLQRAIARVQAQIVKSPQNSEMYVQLSELETQAGDANGSLAAAQKAVQLNANDATALMALTRSELAHGDAATAAAGWQSYLKTHPNDARAYAILGTIEQGRGDKDQAMSDYKKALEFQPDQPIAANNLAFLMVDSGQNADVALNYAQNARRIMPNSPSTADTLAWVYYAKGTYESARDLLEEAVKAAPDDPAIQYHLGMTYSKLSDKTNAMSHLKKAVALAPESESGKDAQKALQQMG